MRGSLLHTYKNRQILAPLLRRILDTMIEQDASPVMLSVVRPISKFISTLKGIKFISTLKGMLPVGGRFRRWVAGFLLIADRQLDVRTFAVVPGKLYITFIFGTIASSVQVRSRGICLCQKGIRHPLLTYPQNGYDSWHGAKRNAMTALQGRSSP